MCSIITTKMVIGVIIIMQYLRATVEATADIALPGCPESCGDITIPFPFGIGPGCYGVGFEVICNQNSHTPKLFLSHGTPETEILDISLQESIIRVKSSIFTVPFGENGETTYGIIDNAGLFLSSERNIIVAFGCDILVQATRPALSDPSIESPLGACVSVCPFSLNGSCGGLTCCQSPIMGISIGGSFNLQLTHLRNIDSPKKVNQNSALLVESDWFDKNFEMLEGLLDPFSEPTVLNDSMVGIPFVIDWIYNSPWSSSELYGRGNGNIDCTVPYDFICSCKQGFEGNPYMMSGCQDVDECMSPDFYRCYGTCINKPGTYECNCPRGTEAQDAKVGPCLPIRKISGQIIIIGVCTGFGLIGFLLGGLSLIRWFRIRRSKKLRRVFFKRNHGLLLEQLISSNKDIAERLKIFSLEELEKATNKFDPNRIVGRGGHGVVYKGILTDQRVVAVKKSSLIIQREIDQFVNEVAILSQIDHRNVVKLYGCCLESQVPLLVYEFISNGTLFNHLHHEGYDALSWVDRFRIALETARALAHLHSAASISVFHRDIKSANILLDDYLTVKVSDFGASRLIPMDQTGINTAIQGTHGYLDPEYHYTGRLTEKSDVFSFGVILAELLTREKPISITKFEMGENLAAYFCSAMRRNCLNEILDPQITEEEHKIEIEAVSSLAEMCLRLRGAERPTMKQVETRLEVLHGSKKRQLHPWVEERSNESEKLINDQLPAGGDSTRQYSLETEMISSSHFPR